MKTQVISVHNRHIRKLFSSDTSVEIGGFRRVTEKLTDVTTPTASWWFIIQRVSDETFWAVEYQEDCYGEKSYYPWETSLHFVHATQVFRNEKIVTRTVIEFELTPLEPEISDLERLRTSNYLSELPWGVSGAIGQTYGVRGLEDSIRFVDESVDVSVGLVWVVFEYRGNLYQKFGYYSSFDGYTWKGDIISVEAKQQTFTKYVPKN